jgi:hypothetical protein
MVMGYQLWIADVLRAAGCSVVEVSGWRTRGLEEFRPEGVIAHETRGSWTSTVAGEVNVMINGREGLSGPIAHCLLARSGDWHVVTAGKSNHVKTGWGGLFAGLGNTNLLGIEAQHATGEPWTVVQYNAYVRGVAAICRHMGWQVGGHFEHQPGDKTDPAFNMDTFRHHVTTNTLIGDPAMMLLKTRDNPAVYISDGQHSRPVPEGHWELTCVPLMRAGVPLLDGYANLTQLLEAGGPLAATVELSDEQLDQIVTQVTAALAGQADESVDEIKAEVRDAVADLGEGGSAAVRADAP